MRRQGKLTYIAASLVRSIGVMSVAHQVLLFWPCPHAVMQE
jgi:hypothetical protein